MIQNNRINNLVDEDDTEQMAALLASPPSDPKIIVTNMRIDTSTDLVNKTSDDFYSKISSID